MIYVGSGNVWLIQPVLNSQQNLYYNLINLSPTTALRNAISIAGFITFRVPSKLPLTPSAIFLILTTIHLPLTAQVPPSLSQADYQETHHTSAGSSDLFVYIARSPREIQVVIPSRGLSSSIDPRQSSSPEPAPLSNSEHPRPPQRSSSLQVGPHPSLQRPSSLQRHPRPSPQGPFSLQRRSRSPLTSTPPSLFHPQPASPSLRHFTRSRSRRVRLKSIPIPNHV